VTASIALRRWQPNVRVITEERLPEHRVASARLRFRPGVDYRLPVHRTRPPVIVLTDELFVVPGNNSFPAGGRFTQNRFQAGVRLAMNDSASIRPYYMLQSLNLPTGWRLNDVIGLSLGLRF
jgi:hypothetical protein